MSSGVKPAPPLSPFKTTGLRWESLGDRTETCRYEVLRYKHMKRGDYFPGVESMARPTCYEDIVTQRDWEEKIYRINQAILAWWTPGNCVRNASYVMGTVCLLVPCLVVYCAMDEVGYFCFVNRKRKQLRALLDPICAALCDDKLTWSVEYRRRSGEKPKGPDNQQAENSKAVYITITRRDLMPVDEFPAMDRSKTPPDTSRVSEEDSDRAVELRSSLSSAASRSKPLTPRHAVHPAELVAHPPLVQAAQPASVARVSPQINHELIDVNESRRFSDGASELMSSLDDMLQTLSDGADNAQGMALIERCTVICYICLFD